MDNISKPVIFLDFDGVLHPHVRHEPDFCCLPLLWQILRAIPEARIVFSTSWREDYRLEEITEFITYGGGEDLADRIIGRTPSLESESMYGRRDLEILSWLDTNQHTGRWLALDDMPEIFNGNPNLYVVDGSTGLTETDVAAIVAILSADTISAFRVPMKSL